MKKIVVLNGSTRRSGHLDHLTQRAQEVGHLVTEIRTNTLTFDGALWSNEQTTENPYQLTDYLDMPGQVGTFYRAVNAADVVVLASPIYWWTVAGNLKQAVDYLQPLQQALGYRAFVKESALLAVAGGYDYNNLLNWYHNFEHYLKWPNKGEVLGADQVAAARQLGRTI